METTTTINWLGFYDHQRQDWAIENDRGETVARFAARDLCAEFGADTAARTPGMTFEMEWA